MFGEADIMFEAASSLHEKMCEYFLLKEQCHEIKKLFGIVKKINIRPVLQIREHRSSTTLCRISNKCILSVQIWETSYIPYRWI